MFDTKRRLKVRDFDLDLKADGVAEDGTFTGYGSVFGVVDSYNEVVAPGAFADSLKELQAKGRKIPVLWQHMEREPIGAYDEVVEDGHGLKVAGRLLIDGVARAKEAQQLMQAGIVSGLSIGYWVRESSFDEKTKIRTLERLDLVEISLVTFPACDDARIEAVKMKLAHGQLPELPEFEKYLREAGFSKSQAAAVANRGLGHLLRSESEGAAASGAAKAFTSAVADFQLPSL
ncbi:HK97 family phage prohead protease [Sphingorhabdus soli]|uniref:HK97 family phage prohead protease n=1 Tax=Flavisphingopyxis soli TaxID=2601267 RepID=A0A5C6UST5_9SPHN|nr:HK97 family phage prohead protease [Sphingorhabdus soli]TXC73958.1 HK97 family phage prohead protease [Sphingorhabdus soli]